MVKVMQALEKRAPMSTENIGGKEYKLATNGKVYYSRDRKTDDGKDIVDVGYFPILGQSSTSNGAISVQHIMELTNSKSKVISADLPFIQTVNWYNTLFDPNYTATSLDVYCERYDYSTKKLDAAQGEQAHMTTLIMDEQKPFARVFANPYYRTTANGDYKRIENRYSSSPMFMLEKNTDSLVVCGQLPLFLKKYNIAPEDGYIKTRETSRYPNAYNVGIYSDFIGKFDIYDKIKIMICSSTENGLSFTQDTERTLDEPGTRNWLRFYDYYKNIILSSNSWGAGGEGSFDGWIRLAFVMK